MIQEAAAAKISGLVVMGAASPLFGHNAMTGFFAGLVILTLLTGVKWWWKRKKKKL